MCFWMALIWLWLTHTLNTSPLISGCLLKRGNCFVFCGHFWIFRRSLLARQQFFLSVNVVGGGLNKCRMLRWKYLHFLSFNYCIKMMYVKLSLLTSDLSAIQAAAHIHRYLTLDESILLESSADSAKGDDLSLSDSLSLSLSLSLIYM